MTKDWVGVWGRWRVAAHAEADGRFWGLGLHLDAGPGTAPGVAVRVSLIASVGPVYATVTLERLADG